jgi:hypothetical protein
MYSSRKYSVKRHIDNIHDGNGVFVSYIDYLAGRRSGLYMPSFPPTYQKKKEQQNKPDYLGIWKEEILRESVRKNLVNAKL